MSENVFKKKTVIYHVVATEFDDLIEVMPVKKHASEWLALASALSRFGDHNHSD